MSGVIELSGTIVAGPTTITDTTFPGMQGNVPLHTTPTPKGWQVCTGMMSRNVASPAAYVTLDGIGASAGVTHADFLYLRCNSTLRLRITAVDGLGTLLSEQDVNGLFIIEKPSGSTITLLEAKGTATVEYLASGQS